MIKPKYSFLDYGSEDELLDYESKLYDVFYDKYRDNELLYSRIWKVSNNRLKSRIEY